MTARRAVLVLIELATAFVTSHIATLEQQFAEQINLLEKYKGSSMTCTDLHLDTSPGASVQAALDGVPQSSILDWAKVDFEAWVSDGMHLLDEGQG